MNCANCGRENARHEYAGALVERYVVLKSSMNRFKYQLDYYVRGEAKGGPVFIRRKGKRVKLLMPDFVHFYEDAHAYWVSDTAVRRSIFLCSRQCAINFAATNNMLLMRKKDGVQITPHQAVFDEYARTHNLAHWLALMHDDEWTTPEAELKGLMQTRLQSPKRLIALACAVIDEGKTKLAEQAVNKVIAEYDITESAQLCPLVLSRLGRYQQIDLLYEQLADSLGGRNKLPAQVLTSWAFAISFYDLGKALKLSEQALHSAPTLAPVVENHLALLSVSEPSKGVDFFRDNSSLITGDIGFYAAGQAFLRMGFLTEAEENLRLSDSLQPDPMTKVYLAEVLYRLGRYAEAQKLCCEGKILIDSFTIRAADDFDGEIRNPSHYPYTQKKGLVKAFLTVEGKCLVALGESESGRQRIQDAVDLNLGFESKDVIYDQIWSLVGDYPTKRELEQNLAVQQRQIAEIIMKKRKSDTVAQRLGDIISELASTQKEWHDSLCELKDAACADLLSEHFLSKIHTYCVQLRNQHIHEYRLMKEQLRLQYAALPERVIEQLANAEYLLKTHDENSPPIFSGAMIEYCKAIETAVNEVVVQPFLKTWLLACSRADIEITTPNARPRIIEVGFHGKPRSLMLGELILLLKYGPTEWSNYCGLHFGRHAEWVRNDLAQIIRTVKDEYRNGAAHYTSVSRSKVLALKQYLSNSNVFALLNGGSALKGPAPDP